MIESRTDSIRRQQEDSGHAPCFGRQGKFGRGRSPSITPSRCGEAKCIYRTECLALHIRNPLHPDRIREDSIELVSRVLFAAQEVEGSSQHSSLQADAQEAMARWAEDCPQVALLGPFSSGKSTLINRLLGRELLPSSRTATTAVVTAITHGPIEEGEIGFKRLVRLLLVDDEAGTPDQDALRALRSWLEHPASFGLATIEEDGKGIREPSDLKSELDAIYGSRANPATTRTAKPTSDFRRTIFRRRAASVPRLARSLTVTFEPRESKRFRLQDALQLRDFHQHLIDPTLALTVRKAICRIPDERLRSFSFLDTAGLCSPVAFHKEVTAELLKRRPDKIVVLLDSRRLDSTSNNSALKTLGERFISSPEDYRQVTFALTFWDFALRTFMEEDTDPPLDFSSERKRADATELFLAKKRADLAALLSEVVGYSPYREPTTFATGVGVGAPPEMSRALERVWGHLNEDCSSWVGIEMWASRWRGDVSFGDRLEAAHSAAIARVRAEAAGAEDKRDAEHRARRLEELESLVKEGVKRCEGGIRRFVVTSHSLFKAEIAQLNSRSALVGYLEKGSPNLRQSSKERIDQLAVDSQAMIDDLSDLLPGIGKNLESIRLDEKILGLETEEARRLKARVSGFTYRAKAAVDFVAGSLIDYFFGSTLTETHFDDVKKVLRQRAREFVDLIEEHTDRWLERVKVAEADQLEKIGEQRALVRAKRAELRSLKATLRREEERLVQASSSIRRLVVSMKSFANQLSEAAELVRSSGHPGFRLELLSGGRRYELKKGREADKFLLFSLPTHSWDALEIRIGSAIQRLVPIRIQHAGRVLFGPENEHQRAIVVPPPRAIRFELSLGRREGVFRF